MSVVPIDFRDDVNDFDVCVNIFLYICIFCIFFSFVCPMTHMNAKKCYWNVKIVIESGLCANVRIFALMNVSSHYWSPFDANDCVFLVMNSKRRIAMVIVKFRPRWPHTWRYAFHSLSRPTMTSGRLGYNTIQYNSLVTLPWWGFSVTMRLKKN